MTLDQILDALRGLGVLIPLDLSEEQLLNQAKALCPWTMHVEADGDHYIAYTSKGKPESMAQAETAAHAGMKLLLKQLEGKRYTAFDTSYKTAARSRHK